MPHFVSDEAQDLISKILVVDPASRITMEGIKNHPWFAKDLPDDLFEKTEALEDKLEELVEFNKELEVKESSLAIEDSMWHQTISTFIDVSMSLASLFLPVARKSPSTASLVTSDGLFHKISRKSHSTINFVASEELLHQLSVRCQSW